MTEQFTSNNSENNKFSWNRDESDYQDLILILREIKLTIDSLEKQYLDKF